MRTALIAFVLVLLLRPVLLAEFRGERPRAVVLLLDNTQSMHQQDRRLQTPDRIRVALARDQIPYDGSLTDAKRLDTLTPEQRQPPERIDLVKYVLANPQWQLLDGLRGRGPLQPFLFGRKMDSPLTADLNSALRGDQGQTALADALHELLARGGELPTAIVVMTDGRDNASKITLDEAAAECRDKGVPLHMYGVGSSQGILQLKDVSLPDPLFIDSRPEIPDDPVEATVRWRCRGITEGKLVLTLQLGEQTERREVAVRDGEDLEERSASCRPRARRASAISRC